jgi:hypothetical protein
MKELRAQNPSNEIKILKGKLLMDGVEIDKENPMSELVNFF